MLKLLKEHIWNKRRRKVPGLEIYQIHDQSQPLIELQVGERERDPKYPKCPVNKLQQIITKIQQSYTSVVEYTRSSSDQEQA